MRRGIRIGQVVVEYAVFFAICVAAMIAMQIYVKRGIAGGYRGAADSFGRQYAPNMTDSDWITDFRGTSAVVSSFLPNQVIMVNGAPRTVDVMNTTTYIGAFGLDANGVVTFTPGMQMHNSVGQETVNQPAGQNLWANN
jgi:hypothetical protein